MSLLRIKRRSNSSFKLSSVQSASTLRWSKSEIEFVSLNRSVKCDEWLNMENPFELWEATVAKAQRALALDIYLDSIHLLCYLQIATNII